MTLNFKITDLPKNCYSLKTYANLKREITYEPQKKFIHELLNDYLLSWGNKYCIKYINYTWLCMLNMKGLEYICKHIELHKYFDMEMINFSIECFMPFFLGYVILENDKSLTQCNSNVRYIRVIKSLTPHIGVGTFMIKSMKTRLHKDVIPLHITWESTAFWGGFFEKIYDITSTYKINEFIKNLRTTDDLYYNYLLLYFTEQDENKLMLTEDKQYF